MRHVPSAILIASAGIVMGMFIPMTIPETVEAHDLPVERGIVVQMSQTQASVLVSYQDPRKARAEVVYKRYDLNGDGKLSNKEAKLAAKMLLPIALQGLQLEVPGFAPAAHSPKIKVKRSRSGELMMLALVNYTLPKWKPGDVTRQFKVSLKGNRAYPPIQVTFMGVEGVKLTAIEPKTIKRLRPGQQIKASFKLPTKTIKGNATKGTPLKKQQKK